VYIISRDRLVAMIEQIADYFQRSRTGMKGRGVSIDAFLDACRNDKRGRLRLARCGYPLTDQTRRKALRQVIVQWRLGDYRVPRNPALVSALYGFFAKAGLSEKLKLLSDMQKRVDIFVEARRRRSGPARGWQRRKKVAEQQAAARHRARVKAMEIVRQQVVQDKVDRAE